MDIAYWFYIASTIRLLAAAFAPPHPAAPLTEKVLRQLRNSTFLFNAPVTLRPSSVNVSDPWDMRVQGPPITIEFYGYQAPLNKFDAQRCVEKAASEAADRVLWVDWTTPMEPFPHFYSYTDGRVNLWLRIEPGQILLWLYWFEVLDCFPQYVEANAWRGTQFIILWDEPDESQVVAFGHLLAE